jgi:hypothetical protein
MHTLAPVQLVHVSWLLPSTRLSRCNWQPCSPKLVPSVALTRLQGMLPSSCPHKFAAPYATKQLKLGPCLDIQPASKLPEMLVLAMCSACRLLGSLMLLALPERPGLSLRMRALKEAVPLAQTAQIGR